MILVSSCLAGNNCTWKGTNNENLYIKELVDKGLAIPICPEVLGGLSVPRNPSEIRNSKVITNKGVDVTDQFNKGAYKTLELCKKYNCNKAILNEKSPSCGTKYTYDGTFTNTLVNKMGVTAKLLKENGIEVISSEDIDKIKLLLEI